MLRLVHQRVDRTLAMWAAVVVARGGPIGAAQTLATLESIISSWSEKVDDWSVTILAPQDADQRAMTAGLGGSLDIRWGEVDIRMAVKDARSAGRRPHVFVAGDAVSAADWRMPVGVPLVSGSAFPSDSTEPSFREGINTSPLRWDRHPRQDLHHDIVVFRDAGIATAGAYRSSYKIAWLLDPEAVSPEDRAGLASAVSIFDLVISSDPEVVKTVPRAAFCPRAGCVLSLDHQGIGRKVHDLSVLVTDSADVTARETVDLVRAQRPDADVFRLEAGSSAARSAVARNALASYRYCVLAGPRSRPGQVDEHLVAAWRSGTVPICARRPEEEGAVAGAMLTFTTTADLAELLTQADATHHEAARKAAARAYDAAERYLSREAMIYPLLEPYLMRMSH